MKIWDSVYIYLRQNTHTLIMDFLTFLFHSSSPCARGSPYESRTLHRPSSRPSSREGLISSSREAAVGMLSTSRDMHSSASKDERLLNSKRPQPTASEEVPVRDTIPTSMWCSTVETSAPQVYICSLYSRLLQYYRFKLETINLQKNGKFIVSFGR